MPALLPITLVAAGGEEGDSREWLG
jgi:hypothetical protein